MIVPEKSLERDQIVVHMLLYRYFRVCFDYLTISLFPLSNLIT